MPVHDWSRVDAGIFHDFHVTWIGALRTALNSGLLPEDYYALAEPVANDIEPDVLTLQSPVAGGDGTASDSPGVEGSVATMAPPQVELTYRFVPDAYTPKRRTLAIRHRSGHRVVALIEILSRGNKACQHAIDTFLAKAVRALHQGIHRLLVDLHPPTPRDPKGIHAALWELLTSEEIDPPPRPLTLASYKAAEEWTAYVQPVAPGEKLAAMPLFLRPDFYLEVPLEQTYEAVYSGTPRFYRKILEA